MMSMQVSDAQHHVLIYTLLKNEHWMEYAAKVNELTMNADENITEVTKY